MNILNFLCKLSGGMIALLVVDIILVLAIVGALVFIFIKKKPNLFSNSQKTPKPVTDENGETNYIVEENSEQTEEKESEPVSQPLPDYGNKVEHFSNQIFEVSEPASSELKSKVTMKPRVSEIPVKHIVKEETVNYSEKSETPIKTQSFEHSTSLLDVLKTQQGSTAQKSKASGTAAQTKPKTTSKTGTSKPRTTTAKKTTKK